MAPRERTRRSATPTLPPALYSVTLTVTDDQGARASAMLSIVVTQAAPAAPSDLKSSTSGRTVALRWTDNATDEAGFRIQRATRRTDGTWTGFKTVANSGSDATTFTQTLRARGTYMYQVRAFSRTSNGRILVSAPSNPVTVTVPDDACSATERPE